jgi:hypothetical protein
MEGRMTTEIYNNIDANRLYELKLKIEEHRATKQEKNELMRILYENEAFPTDLYTQFINGKDTESLLKTGRMAANLILFGYVLSKYDFSSLRVR